MRHVGAAFLLLKLSSGAPLQLKLLQINIRLQCELGFNKVIKAHPLSCYIREGNFTSNPLLNPQIS